MSTPPLFGNDASASQRSGLREAGRAVVLKSVALVLEFGERIVAREPAHVLAERAEREAARPAYRRVLRALAAVLLIVSLSAAVLAIPPESYEALGDYGYLGVFLVTLVTTGAFVLPVPYLVFIAKAGSLLNPMVVALVAGLAAATGEMTGYLLGYGGRELLGESRWHQAVERWMRRYGFLTITVFAFIPNPAFDAAGIAAGALRYPAWRFWLACFIGKTAKFVLVAAFGALL